MNGFHSHGKQKPGGRTVCSGSAAARLYSFVGNSPAFIAPSSISHDPWPKGDALTMCPSFFGSPATPSHPQPVCLRSDNTRRAY
jgi:hypothetical protein